MTKRILLTDRKIQSLKPAPKDKRVQVNDALVPGLGVRVTDKGVKTFIMQSRFGDEHPTRRELGRYGAMTLEEARDKAREWTKLIKRGIDPLFVEEQEREENLKKKNTTFSSVCEDYFARKLAKQRSGKMIEKRMRKHLFPAFADAAISDITDLDILAKVVNPRAIKTPSMARQLFNDLGAFFSWVVDQRVYALKASPCATIKISKIVGRFVPRQRVLNDDELRALWIGATRLPYPFGPLYRGLVLSALRVRELMNTDRAEWNLRGNSWEWTIPASRMKGKIAHVVPITADLHEIYDACPKRQKFLFSCKGGDSPMRLGESMKEQIDAEMLKVLREIAIERGDDPETVVLAHWTNHDIRRTVRSRLSRIKGISLEAREAILAHVKPGIQRVYDVHDYLDEKREALEAWAAELRRIVEPPPANVVPIRKPAA
jgi:integrase